MSPLLKSGGREIYEAAHVLHPHPTPHLPNPTLPPKNLLFSPF